MANNLKTLKQMRKAAGITQSKIAEDAGVQAVTYSNYESDWRTPPVQTANAIAAAFQKNGINVDLTKIYEPSPHPIRIDQAISIVNLLEKKGIKINLDVFNDTSKAA